MDYLKRNGKFYKDKVVMIIGAAGGIGSAITRQLSHYGARLALVGRNIESLRTLSAMLPGSAVFKMDITVDEEIHKTITGIYDTLGAIDIAINLAGYSICKPFDHFSSPEIIKTTNTNFESCIALTRALLPQMISHRYGIIVQINGFASGRLAMPYFALDAGTRAGIAVFSRALNREIKGTGVRIVVFSPSGTDTEAERKRIQLWDKAGIKLESREIVAKRLITGLAIGREEICLSGFGEKLLSLVEFFSPKGANVLFWNKFTDKLKPLFSRSCEYQIN